MKSSKNPRKLLIGYSAFVAVCAMIVLGWMLDSPSEPGSSFLFGLSRSRLALALGLFVALILFTAVTIRAAKNREWAGKFLDERFGRGGLSQITGWLGWISFGLGWIGVFLPPYRVDGFEDHWVRLQPVAVFILLAGIATLALLYERRRVSSLVDRSVPGILRSGMILFLMCLLALTIMLFSGFGIQSQDDFWYGAGVPILIQQLMGAIAGGMLFLQIEKKWDHKRLDLLMSVLIFAVTAFLWAREPLQRGFSLVEYPPNNDLYPLYDAAFFDAGSQFPLIGQRVFLYGTYFFERPLYPVLLFYLHALFGQDYETVMAGQAAVFAIFPALIYMIGRSLNLRPIGVAAALVAMFRGINAIAASNMIDLANPKMMLTDFPAAIGVALVVLAICEWLKQPAGKWQYALWVGGAIGFTLMLRTNALMLLALIPLYAVFKFSRDWKNWVFHSSLLILAIIAITLPWELRNRALGGQMYGSIIGKFRAVIEQRYTAPSGPESSIPSLLLTRSLSALSALYQGEDPVQNDPGCESVACFVPNHFLHNIVASVLVLPTSPVMDDLRHTVRDHHPYWNPRWDGAFAFPTLFCFTLNVFLITLGVGGAWKRGRLPGLAPLAIFLFYDLSNAFARTSGGRYVVPMDWIITIYFLAGVFQIMVWVGRAVGVQWALEFNPAGQNMDHSESTPGTFSKTTFALFILLGVGSLLPLSENLFSERYQNFDPGQALAENKQALETAGLGIPSIESFLQNPNAEILRGRALYPRYFLRDQQEAVFFPSLPLFYPRTTFDLIGPEGQRSVVLPGAMPPQFPHASDVVVVGCREQYYFDALAVIILGENGTVYVRLPESELTCPLRQPVCDNNSVCK